MGNENLTLDDVESGHDLRNRVLHLNARIDLDEKELARILVHQELDGAGIIELHRSPNGQRCFENALAHLGIEVVRRSDFHDLLMPALQGTVAFKEMDQAAMFIAQQLHFDMACPLDVAFQKDIRRAKRGPCLAARLVQRFFELCRFEDDAHPAPATAHRGLDDYWIAQFLG